MEQTCSEESDWKVLPTFLSLLFFPNNAKQSKVSAQLTVKNFRGHLSKQGKVTEVHMLFFSRRRTVTLEISKLHRSGSARDVCLTSQSSEEQHNKKALLSQAEAVQPNQVHSRLNSVVQSIFNNWLCHFIFVEVEVPSQISH